MRFLNHLGDTRYLVKKVLFSETEPIGVPGLLWVHTDPVSRCTVYFLWENNKWYNLFDRSTNVTWNQLYSEGTKIGEITIDGVKTEIYIPDSGVQNININSEYSEGIKIAEITVDSSTYEIYSPTPDVQEAPTDGKKYGRENGEWVEINEGSNVEVSPEFDSGVKIATIIIDGDPISIYTTEAEVSEAPADGKKYARMNGQWVEIAEGSEGIPDAPIDGNKYARRNGQWIIDEDGWMPRETIIPSGGMRPNVFYSVGEIDENTQFLLGPSEHYDRHERYVLEFSVSGTPQITFDPDITWDEDDFPTISDGMTCQVSVTDGFGLIKCWDEGSGPTPPTPSSIKALKFTAVGDSSIGVRYESYARDVTFEKSSDGINWTPLVLGNTPIQVNSGESIYIRGNNPNGIARYVEDFRRPYGPSFYMNGIFTCEGNIMWLLDYAQNLTTIPNDYCFYQLFKDCTGLVSAPELPATTLKENCYSSMFEGCTGLLDAPELLATTMKEFCYSGMFKNCTSLEEAPELPSTSLDNSCYINMFSGCTSLIEAPELNALILKSNCYANMFNGCTSLVAAPTLQALVVPDGAYSGMFKMCVNLETVQSTLPATSLGTRAYSGMFSGCIKLATPPALPATTLGVGCYSYMFENCASLLTAPILPATTVPLHIPSTNIGCYSSMFKGCSNINEVTVLVENLSNADTVNFVDMLEGVNTTGTLYCPQSSQSAWQTLRSYVKMPSNWTIEVAS